MPVLACGINHKSAPLPLREKVAIGPKALTPTLRAIQGSGLANEISILSTCNRTEWYCDKPVANDLFAWICAYLQIPETHLKPHFYQHCHEDAIKHMLRVASGLDSMALGEPQVFGQMKQAYLAAEESGTLGKHLHNAFQFVFSASKRIRESSAIGEGSVSCASIAVSLAEKIFADLKTTRVALIGAGDMMSTVLHHLQERGVKDVYVVNRTLARAQALANRSSAIVATFAELNEILKLTDIVFTCTGSTLPIIGKGSIETAIKRRKHRPMFLVDLAVPRDVEAEVAELPDVFLYNIDDLHRLAEEGLSQRIEAAKSAEQLVERHAAEYISQLKMMRADDTIKYFREQAEQWKADELAQAQKMLLQGHDPQAVLQLFAHRLTNKLLHPSQSLIRKVASGDISDVTTLFAPSECSK